MGNLRGHGPTVAHQVTVKVPRYVDNPVWERYQQAVEFHMETIFPGKTFELSSPHQTYTTLEDRTLYKVLCGGVNNDHWTTLERRYKGRGAEGFRALDQQVRGDIHQRKARARVEEQNLRFTEQMDVATYSNKLHQVASDLIEYDIHTPERCALELLLTQTSRLPARFSIFARDQKKILMTWNKPEPPCIIEFLRLLAQEESMIQMDEHERKNAPAVHAAAVNPQGGVPTTTIAAVTTAPVTTTPPVMTTTTPTPAQRPPPGPGGSGRGRTNFNGPARREWQRPYQKNYNSNCNSRYQSNYYRGNGQGSYNDYKTDGYYSRGKPTCTKCGRSGRGHTAYDCWRPDCTRCRTSQHTLASCPRA